MYGPRPIRFSAHWCADYSKYRRFLAGGISTASSLLPFFGTRLLRQNFNLALTQYRQLSRLGKARSYFTWRSAWQWIHLVGTRPNANSNKKFESHLCWGLQSSVHRKMLFQQSLTMIMIALRVINISTCILW